MNHVRPIQLEFELHPFSIQSISMKKEHKVILVGPLPPPIGGVSSHIAGLASFLTSRNIDCAVIDGYPEEKEKITIPHAEHIVFKGPWRFVKILSHLFLRECRLPGIVHLHFSNGIGRLLAFCVVLFHPKMKIYLTLHNGDQEKLFKNASWALRLFSENIIRRMDRVFALSSEQERFYLSIGMSPARISQWPPIVTWLVKGDDSLLPHWLKVLLPIESGGHETILLTSGYPQKDYQFEQCLRLLNEIPKTIPVKLLISLYGKAENRTYEAELRQRLQKDPRVIVLEPLPHEGFIALLSKASLYLRPSSVDSFGLAITESLNQGVPCLASNVCNRDPRCITFTAGDFDMFRLKALDIINQGRAERRRPGIGPMNSSDFDKITPFYRNKAEPTHHSTLRPKEKKVACFFSTEKKSQLLKQQYSIQDIKILQDLGFEVKIARRLSEIPFGCDLYFGWWASGSVLPLIVSKLSGKPIIVVAGGNEALFYRDSLTGEPAGYLSSPIYKKIATRLTLKTSTVILVVSDFMKNGVERLCGRPVTVVYNSIDTDQFNESAKTRNFITMIFNFDQRVVQLKRGEVFLRAIPLILKEFPSQKFVIIGKPGNASVRIERLLDNLGIKHCVNVIGVIPNTDMVAWMQASKAYVQISDTETFGVAIGEALSCKTPVVVSRNGAIPELVGDCGVYVDHDDPQSVADGVISILKMNPEALKELGDRSRKRILASFSYTRRRDSIEKILLSIGVTGKARPYQICENCVMDTSDSSISFDKKGVCDHCNGFRTDVLSNWYPNDAGKEIFRTQVKKIKRSGKGKPFDCIIGMSGGLDSSFLLHLAVTEFGLRPLVFHVDGGWNTDIAVNNIQVLVEKLGLDLYTEVINWEEMRNLQLSFFKSGVPHLDVPQDHAFFATLYHFANKHNIKYILNGGNFATECVRNPKEWLYYGSDMAQLRDIHRQFGTRQLESYPFSSVFFHKIYLRYFRRIKVVKPLNYLPYTKENATEVLSRVYGWRAYPQKHFESRFTRFYEGYWLPTRFGFDTRRVQYSSLILTGQMSRDFALALLLKPAHDPKTIDEDFEYIATKIGISVNELRQYHEMPKKSYRDYKNQERFFDLGASVLKLLGVERSVKR